MSIYEVATIFIGLLASALGAWNTMLWNQIGNMRERIDKLPETYARRDDLGTVRGEIRDVEDKILKAIDNLSARIDTLIQAKHS